MKYLILIIAIASTPSFAVELEFGAGVSKHEKPTNGLWYQEEFSYELEDTSKAFNIGIKHNNWSIGYKYLGGYKSTARASASDENYLNWREGKERIWPLSTWHGKGEVDGIYVNHRHYFGNFFLVGGVWYHRASWEVTIPDWIHSRTDEPRLIKVSEDTKEQSFTVGLGYRYKKWTLSYELWDVQTGSTYPATFGGNAQNINLSYTL